MSDALDTHWVVQTDLAISVRSATASDAPALAALVNRAYAIEEFFVDGDRTNANEIERLLERGTFVVLEYRSGELRGLEALPALRVSTEHLIRELIE